MPTAAGVGLVRCSVSRDVCAPGFSGVDCAACALGRAGCVRTDHLLGSISARTHDSGKLPTEMDPSILCTVKIKANEANYYVESPHAVRDLLKSL